MELTTTCRTCGEDRLAGMTARDFAILDLLHHSYHPPALSHPDHDRQWHLWQGRYRARLAAAQCLLNAVATLEAGTENGVSGPVQQRQRRSGPHSANTGISA